MKKILIAALLACTMGVLAADTSTATTRDAARPAHRQQLTPEQRKERRERFMAQMKARQESIRAKIVDALKEAGLDEAKAKETAEKIQKIYAEGRPQRPAQGGASRPRPEAK